MYLLRKPEYSGAEPIGTEASFSKINILLIEDVPFDAEMISRALKKSGLTFGLFVVNSKETFKVALRDFSPDVILFDSSQPFFEADDALDVVKDSGLAAPFIVIAPTLPNDFAVNVFKKGVDDYVDKDHLNRLHLAIINSLERHRLFAEKLAECRKFTSEMEKINIRLQLAKKSADVGIWDWDLNTGIVEWDEGMYKIFRVNRLDFDAAIENWIELVHPADRRQVKLNLQMALNGRKNYDTEFRMIVADGGVHTIGAKGTVERDGAGKAIRMIGVNFDITERLKYTLAIEKQNVKLREIAFIQSHLVRAPLARMMGLVDLFMGGEDEEVQFKIAGYLREAANEIDKIIKEIMEKAEVVNTI